MNTIKQLEIKFTRVEEFKKTEENLLNIELSELRDVTPESSSTKIDKADRVRLWKEIVLKLHRIDEHDHTKKVNSTTVNETNGSEDTETFTIEEKIIGKITILNNNRVSTGRRKQQNKTKTAWR